MTNKIDLSIIITAHAEGLVAHKTMMSVIAAAEYLKRESVSYEIIISLDNPDETTSDYYRRYEKKPNFKILRVKYGNVADSRNNAINQSRGKYVSLLDGDDMVSSNWYVDAYRLAESKTGLFVLHPKAQLQFGSASDRIGLWLMEDSLDSDAVTMVQYNRWVSALLAPRDVFGKVAYQRPVNGYGYEDYLFNCDTVAAGIKHFVVPQTTLFYRRMSSGKQFEHIHNHTILGHTKLFDFNQTSGQPGKLDCEDVGSNSRYRGGSLVNKLTKSHLARYMYHKTGRLVKDRLRNLVYRKKLNRLPGWLTEQWREINQIDNQLWPTRDDVIDIDYHPISFDPSGEVATRVGRKYLELMGQFTKKPDYIFFTYDPLGAGGTEKVLTNYINTLKELHPDWHFAVMRKKPDKFPFKVPADVDFVDFFGLTDGMHPWEIDILFDRLIIQSEAKRLHCFFNGYANDDYTYDWVKNHRTFLRSNDYKVYVSWFMREYVLPSERGRVMTFADPYLMEIYDCVTRVFTDNQTVIDETLANNAYDRDKFAVHHQPMVPTAFVEPKEIEVDRPLRVLWAGRLSYQKRPDILKKIAERVDAKEIVIDVYGREQNYRGSYLSGISSLNYRGQYNGFSSLPIDKYDAFLYTSQVDGMPNVLLEATAAGLPIVASNDGGVGELIKNNKTGKLVEIEDIDGYVAALREMQTNPKLAKQFVLKCQGIIRKEYTKAQFRRNVQRDIQ